MTLRIWIVAWLLPVIWISGCQKKCIPGEGVDCWINALQNPEKVDKAIDNLRQINDRKAETALIEAFQRYTQNPDAEEKIIELLKKWKTKAAIKPMIAALNFEVGASKEDPKQKKVNRINQRIASALGEMGEPEAIASLQRLMRSSQDPNVQRSAIRSLGNLKAKESVDELIKMTEDANVHKIVRMNAVYALGEIGDPKALDPLVLALYRDKAFFFHQAGLSLVKIGEPAVDLLATTMEGKNEKVNALLQQDADVIEGALESNSAKVLGDIGSPKAVKPLLTILDKVAKWTEEVNQMMVQARVLNALGAIGDKQGLPALLKNLATDHPEMRMVCTNALNAIGDRGVLSELLKVAGGDGDPAAKVPVFETIGNLGTDEHLAKLQELAAKQGSEEYLKTAVADSVQRLQAYAECKQDVGCWIGKLKSPQPAVREKAAYELGRLQDAKAGEALIGALADASESVRFAVGFALEKLKEQKAVAAIEELIEKEKGSARFKMANFNYEILAAKLRRAGG